MKKVFLLTLSSLLVFVFCSSSFAIDAKDKVKAIQNVEQITLSQYENDAACSIAFKCVFDKFNFAVFTNRITSEHGAWQLAYAIWNVFNADVMPTKEFKSLRSCDAEEVHFWVMVDQFGVWDVSTSMRFSEGEVTETVYGKHYNMSDAIKALHETCSLHSN
jgi:hypothetical protein